MNTISKDLEFKFYNVERRIGIEPKMFVTFPEFYNHAFIKDHYEKLKEVFEYTVFKFYMRQLTDGKEIREELKQKDYPFDDLNLFCVEYEDNGKMKSAIVYPMLYRNQFKLSLNPCMEITSGDISGFTVLPGNFSDFYIHEYMGSGRIVGHTRDFLCYTMSLTAIFLEAYVANAQAIVVDENIPDDFNKVLETYYISHPEYRRVIALIAKTIEKKVKINSGKKISTLSVNGKTIFDWIKELDIRYITFFGGEELLKISMELGKPPKQVFQFVEKYLSKVS